FRPRLVSRLLAAKDHGVRALRRDVADLDVVEGCRGLIVRGASDGFAELHLDVVCLLFFHRPSFAPSRTSGHSCSAISCVTSIDRMNSFPVPARLRTATRTRVPPWSK